MRPEWGEFVLVSVLYITSGRKRNPGLLRQNQPIRSLEEEAEELMKHGYVVGAVGLDATKRRVMKSSSTILYIILSTQKYVYRNAQISQINQNLTIS